MSAVLVLELSTILREVFQCPEKACSQLYSITSDCGDCSSLDTLDTGHTIKHTPGTRASGSGKDKEDALLLHPRSQGGSQDMTCYGSEDQHCVCRAVVSGSG